MTFKYTLLLILPVWLASQVAAGAQDASDELFATHGRYQLTAGDVFDVHYRYTPEFNQTVTVQPDGFITLQVAGEVRVGGLTLEQARFEIAKRSSQRLLEPEVALTLKEFEKPYFVVGGEVSKPGKFELRGATTALQAIAMAGGFTPGSKHSQVLLIRRLDGDRAEVKPIDLKRIERQPAQGEEWRLRSGDMLLVPKNKISKVERFVNWSTFGIPIPW